MIDYHNLTPEQEQEMINNEFKALLNDYAATQHKQKVEIITKAFEFANKAHNGTKPRNQPKCRFQAFKEDERRWYN